MIHIKTYANQFEAEFALRVLEQHGIESRVSSQESGGPVPSSFATGGVRLYVEDGDADRAIEILTQASTDPEDDDDDIYGLRSGFSVRSGMRWLIVALILVAASILFALG